MNNRQTMMYRCLLALSVCGVLFTALACSASDRQQKADLFESRYQAWLTARAKWIQENPTMSYLPLLPEAQAILDMGPQTAPFMMRKLERELAKPSWDSRMLAENMHLVWWLTSKAFDKEEWPADKYGDSDPKLKLYVTWWKEGRKHTPARFAALYTEWDGLVKGGQTEKAAGVFLKMRRLGFDALPLVIGKIQDGDERLAPLVGNILFKPAGSETKSRDSVLAWWTKNKDFYKLPESTEEPVAPTGQETK